MQFAGILGFLAACPGLGSRLGSQLHTNTTVIASTTTDVDFALKDACNWCQEIRDGKKRNGDDLCFKAPSMRFQWQEQNPEDPKKRPRVYCREAEVMQGFETVVPEAGTCGPLKDKERLEVGSIGFEHSIPDKVDLTTVNRQYCDRCNAYAYKHHDSYYLFYSWKIEAVDGEKRLVARCAPKQPEQSEGFKTSWSHMGIHRAYCTHRMPGFSDDEARGVKGVKSDFSTASDRCTDILPACEQCAEKDAVALFFWKAEGEGSERKIHTWCDYHAPEGRGWERSPPPPRGAPERGTAFEITKDWCQKTFKDVCGEPQRGLLLWLPLLGVSALVAAAAAGGFVALVVRPLTD